jgi:hypothetical protein
MDSHEANAPVWTPHEPSATSAAQAGTGEAVVEEDVVVIESREAGYADGEDQPDVAGTGATVAGVQQWSEIKAMFVDDPGESVRLASGLVERAIEDLVASLRQRQESLSSWESGNASDTEGLRSVLRSYQNLFDQLDTVSGQFASGRERVA